MKRLIRYIPTLAAALMILGGAVAGCSGDRVTSHVRDREAYNLGQRHAARAVELAGNQAALEDYLLDVRARMNNISVKVSHQAAADYERGFTDGVSSRSDSLARILF